MRWEVSLRWDTAERFVVAADISLEELEDALSRAYAFIADRNSYPGARWKTAAVQILRMDQTPEALRAKWEEQFFSTILYKDGRTGKRRRFKAPQIERDWIEWVKTEKRAAVAASRKENDSYRKATDGS